MKKILLLGLFFLCFLTNTLGQGYKITINGGMRTKDHHMEEDTRVTLQFYTNKGVKEKIYYQDRGKKGYDNGKWWMISDVLTFEGTVYEIRCVGVHRDDPDGKPVKTRGEGKDTKLINETDYPCINVRMENKFMGGYDNGSYVDISIQPVGIQLTYYNTIQYNDSPEGVKYIHEDSPITIKASPTYPRSVYKWEYMIGSNSWQTLDDKYKSNDGSEISVTALDFLSYEQIMDKIPVSFRIKYSCGTSNTIELQPKIAAPKIKRVVEKKAETCPGSSNGEILIELSRNIMPNESVEFLAYFENGHLIAIDYETILPNQCKITNLAPGPYKFQLVGSRIDNHGDEVSTGIVTGDQYTLEETIDPGVALEFSVLDYSETTTCTDSNDGKITAKGEGGSGQYTLFCENEYGDIFESQPGSSEISVNNLPVGTYTVWMVDGNNCETNRLENEVTILGPENPIEVDEISIFRPIEGVENGTITVSAKNGTPPYQAFWKTVDAGGTSLDSKAHMNGGSETSSTLENVGSGQYFVELMDKDGCKTSTTVSLVGLPPFVIDLQQTGTIRCYGDATGELKATNVEGGSPPYSYMWYKVGDYGRVVFTGNTGPVISNIPGGMYRLKIIDNVGNEAWSEPIYHTHPQPIEASFNMGMPKCYGGDDGSLEVSFSGGAGGYNYEWQSGNPGHTGSRVDGLKAGRYEVYVRDNDGCEAIFGNFVTEPSPVTVSGKLYPPSCNGMTNGRIDLTVAGGTQPYAIDWSTGTQNTTTIAPVAAGDYEVTVTDAHNCPSVNKQFNLIEPQVLEAVIAKISSVSANGRSDGSLVTNITGGTQPYRAICKDEQNRTYPVLGAVYPSDKPAYIEVKNLPAGNYTLTVQDVNSQTGNALYDACVVILNFSITEPPPLKITLEELHYVSCHNGKDGKLSALAEGGLPFDDGDPYLYKWYQVFGSNKTLLNNTGNKAEIDSLSPGSYLVEIIDKNNVAVQSRVHTFSNPELIKFKFSAATLICYSDEKGWAEAVVTGGQAPYEYAWSTGETGITRIENKRGGNYALTITDDRGCITTDTARIISPNQIVINHEMVPPLCAGHGDAFISLNVSGGEAPYKYKWSNDLTTAYLENIYPGAYSVKITDDRNCYETTTIVVPEALPVTTEIDTIIQPKAYKYSDGTLSVKLLGGSNPYKIIWTNGDGVSLTPEETVYGDGVAITTLKNVSEGTYYISVEDNNYQLVEQPDPYSPCGCIHSSSFYVPQPPVLEVSTRNSQYIQCFGTNDGQMIATAKGGVPHKEGVPYTYQWYKNNEKIGENDSILSNLGEGNYHVLITDANDISVKSQTISLAEPKPLTMNMTAADLRCSSDTNGWVNTEVTGGTQPYSYNWSSGDSTSRIENLPRGKYFVFVYDKRGCEVSGNVEIIQPGGIKAQADMTQPTCYNGSNGNIRLAVSGGEAPYRYEWDNSQKSGTNSGIRSGAHTVTITDANACSQETYTYELPQPDSIIINLGRDWELCKEQNLELNALIDEPAIAYTWFDESGKQIGTNAAISLKDPGKYRAEVLTQKGCKGAGQITITKADKAIDADFLVASQVPVNEEVLMINVAVPEPDDIEWILPEDKKSSFQVVNNDFGVLEVIFTERGEYQVGMRSFLDKCEKTVFKTIKVMNKEDIEGYEDADEPMIKQFAVAPNPNPGRFNVLLELKESSPVFLQLVDGTGKIVERRTVSGKKEYNESFVIQGKSEGTYILNVISPKAKAVQKVIVH